MDDVSSIRETQNFLESDDEKTSGELSHEKGLLREDKNQLVVFELHDQQFGVNIQNVMEVKTTPEITDVFHTPEFVVGVVNVRGDIIALLDIGLFFNLKRTSLSQDNRMVILQYQNREAGILADTMLGVQWVEDSEIQDPPTTVQGVSSEWIQGVVQRDVSPLILLDIAAIFNSDRIEEL